VRKNANLFICVGQKEILNIVKQGLAILEQQKSDEKFIVFSDAQAPEFENSSVVDWICLEESVFSKGLESNSIAMRKLINRLESQNFDNVYVVENIGWARWMLPFFENVNRLNIRDYGASRRPMTYANMLEILDLEEVPGSSVRKVCHSLDELYACTLRREKALLVTDRADKNMQLNLFSCFHDLLTVPTGTICSSRTKKLVDLWLRGQILSTYAPISSWKFSFHYIAHKKNRAFLASMDKTFKEFDQIKAMVSSYKEENKKIPTEIFELEDGLRRSKQILGKMIGNIRSGVHLFSEIGTVFFSYLIAEHIFSGVCPSRITFFDQKAVLHELEKFENFVLQCEEIISRNRRRIYQ